MENKHSIPAPSNHTLNRLYPPQQTEADMRNSLDIAKDPKDTRVAMATCGVSYKWKQKINVDESGERYSKVRRLFGVK